MQILVLKFGSSGPISQSPSVQVLLSLPYFYVFLLYWFLGNGANGVIKRIQALVQCLVYWFGVWGFGGQCYVYCT